jgi:hypothetical protein
VSTAAESTRSLYSRFNTQIAAVGAALARIRLSKVPLKVTEYSIVHMYHLHILVFRVFPTPIKNINWRAVEPKSVENRTPPPQLHIDTCTYFRSPTFHHPGVIESATTCDISLLVHLTERDAVSSGWFAECPRAVLRISPNIVMLYQELLLCP